MFIHKTDEPFTHEQLVERIRKGATMHPDTPGVSEAAQEVFRPLIEQMKGKEIIYRCRSPGSSGWIDCELETEDFMREGHHSKKSETASSFVT